MHAGSTAFAADDGTIVRGMGALLGKTLYRILERAKGDLKMRVFHRRIRISTFAGGPKKCANLILGKSLLDDVKRGGGVAMKHWNDRVNVKQSLLTNTEV